jgi:hypothetical protein
VEEEGTKSQGSKPVAGAIAGLATAYLTFLPWLLVPISWLFLSGYVVWKLIAGGSDHPSAGVVIGGFVCLVGLLTLALAGGIWAIGRSFAPKRRSGSRI